MRGVLGMAGVALGACLLAGLGAAGHAATYDEVLHLPAACLSAEGDHRVDTFNPILWKRWVGCWVAPLQPSLDREGPSWQAFLARPTGQWRWAVETLYRTPGQDPDRLLARARLAMLPWAFALLLGAGLWAWRLGGPWAAGVATLGLALEPTLLAHAPLVKNDVPLAAAWLGLAVALWALGRRLSGPRLALATLALTAAVTIKLSGLLGAALVPVSLGLRALEARPWRTSRGLLRTRRQRLAGAALASAVLALGTWGGVWGVYGLRSSAGPGGARLPDAPLRQELEQAGVAGTWGVRAAWAARRAELLPEAWVHGLLRLQANARGRPAWLAGEVHQGGRLAYFPLAFLLKEPLSLLAALALALGLGAAEVRRGWRPLGPTARALLLPGGLYLAVALLGGLNAGVRHLLPLTPLLFVALGLAAARARARRGRAVTLVLAGLGLGLALEVGLAFPHWLSWFNAAAGGSRGGLRWLGDSNLDWGQDLRRLASWARARGPGRLYLNYFGRADPAAYGIDYVNLPGGYAFGPPARLPEAPGVLVVSATALQGYPYPPRVRAFYAPLLAREPDEVIGTTLYVYRWAPP